MQRQLPFLLMMLMASCVACGKKEAVTTEQLEQIILADKRATVPICTRVTMPPVDKLPAKFQLSAEKDNFFQDFKILERHGYATIKKVTTTDPFGGAQIGAWEVSLTPKWATDLGSTMSGDRCIGHWKAQSVTAFTPPVDDNGTMSTRVKVNGTQAYEAWAADPELRSLFRLAPLRAEKEREYVLVRKDSTWEVTQVTD